MHALLLLQARDTVEAIRLRANWLKVWRTGKLLAQTPAAVTRLEVPGRPEGITFAQH